MKKIVLFALLAACSNPSKLDTQEENLADQIRKLPRMGGSALSCPIKSHIDNADVIVCDDGPNGPGYEYIVAGAGFRVQHIGPGGQDPNATGSGSGSAVGSAASSAAPLPPLVPPGETKKEEPKKTAPTKK